MGEGWWQPGASPPWFGMGSCSPGFQPLCDPLEAVSWRVVTQVSPAPAVLGLGVPIVGAHPCPGSATTPCRGGSPS